MAQANSEFTSFLVLPLLHQKEEVKSLQLTIPPEKGVIFNHLHKLPGVHQCNRMHVTSYHADSTKDTVGFKFPPCWISGEEF